MHAITVMDRRGHRYLDPSNPSLGDISRDRAREEELSEKILEKLDWIKGVRVLVQVSAPQHAASRAARGGSSSTIANPPLAADRSLSNDGNSGPGPAGASGAPAIVVNGPAELETEPAPTKPIAATPVASESAVEPDRESGHVLVNVPRSFYYNALVNKADHLEPSSEEFQLMAARIETGVKKTIELVLPERGTWKVDVDTIPDELPIVRPAVLPYPAESRRKALDWGIVGAVGAAISILAAVGSWIQVARRSARPPRPEVETARYRTDLASEPGPSERVRELVRRNPEAAASVLQRWTVGGGSAS